MNNKKRKQLMSLFMQQIWNEGNFSRLTDMVAPAYHVSHDDYVSWSGQTIDHETFTQSLVDQISVWVPTSDHTQRTRPTVTSQT